MSESPNTTPILEIDGLVAGTGGKQILNGVNLVIHPGQVHALMGPNGSGKSTLAAVLAGHPGYEVVRGRVLFQGRDLLGMSPDARARAGLFLAFQYPVELPGVNTMYFLKAALNEVRKQRGLAELDAMEFIELLKQKLDLLELDDSVLRRAVNVGFSGGEKKRNEILQMAVLEPTLAILDEPDSGLDIDALRLVARNIEKLRRPDNAFLLITHYQRLLEHIEPDRVHVFVNGRIAVSGDKTLARELERRGYEWVLDTQTN